jgi:hypothetical protein
MHHFIYPSQDTFITSDIKNNTDTLNFGLNEILKVGSQVVNIIHFNSTSDFFYSTQSVSNWCVTLFTGHIDSGSLNGTSSFITGSVSGSVNISSSNWSGSYTSFFGDVIDFSGKIVSGIVTGTNTVSIPREQVTSSIVENRALVQFDITAISQSIVAGGIVNPHFTLKIKVARAEELPIKYSLTAFPISESWVMGNGYSSDGGSIVGASWIYRDFQNGTSWVSPGATFVGSSVSEQFNYEVGDISMDVTSIVNSWLDQSVINNGLAVVSSDISTGLALFFFSNDSNTIYRPILDVAWDDSSFITQTASTSSVNILTHLAGFYGTVVNNAQLSGSISASFGGVGNLTIDVNSTASGIVVGSGSLVGGSGSISIYGDITGIISQSVIVQLTPCACPANSFTSASVSQSLLFAVFTDGPFISCSLTALWDGYHLSNGVLSGSWTSALLDGSVISSSNITLWPTIVSARLDGPFVDGNMVGSISSTNSSSYGIFQGTLIDDTTSIVSSVYLPFSGSIFLVDTLYTGSVIIESSSLDAVEFNKPFVIVVQNSNPTLKSNNIVRINIFGREEFPLKNFSRLTQFSQFLTPKYLPVTSYYSIKDNQTEEIVVDFDTYTKLSCDQNGNYFLLDTTGLPQERYFRILIKTESSGSVYTMDNGNIFKIVR